MKAMLVVVVVVVVYMDKQFDDDDDEDDDLTIAKHARLLALFGKLTTRRNDVVVDVAHVVSESVALMLVMALDVNVHIAVHGGPKKKKQDDFSAVIVE
jgi:hypothetical protein